MTKESPRGMEETRIVTELRIGMYKEMRKKKKKEGLVNSNNNNVVKFTTSSISDENIEWMLNDNTKMVLRKPVPQDDLQSVVTKFAVPGHPGKKM
jgi:hypothetical protein